MASNTEVIMSAIDKVGADNGLGKQNRQAVMAMIRKYHTEVNQTHVSKVNELEEKVTELTSSNQALTESNKALTVSNQALTESNKVLTESLQAKDTIIDKLQKDTCDLQDQTDASSQYNRRDNFKITGVPHNNGEDLLAIIKEATKHIGREIDEKEISDFHRLPKQSSGSGDTNTPPIIVRVNRRCVKHEILGKKSHLRSHPHPSYPNLGFYEDLTPLRSRMLYALRNRKTQGGNKVYKFTWSKQGRIFCRTEQQTIPSGPDRKIPKPSVVNKPSDLINLGFTQEEVNEIISPKRK